MTAKSASRSFWEIAGVELQTQVPVYITTRKFFLNPGRLGAWSPLSHIRV